VVTLGIRIGQQVEEDYGVSDKATKEADLGRSGRTVVRIEKQSLDIDEKLSK
jgi:hypothetical protein